jgi:hypothetical protein
MSQSFSNTCLYCGHKIGVVLKSNKDSAKIAYYLKKRNWLIHKIRCEEKFLLKEQLKKDFSIYKERII